MTRSEAAARPPDHEDRDRATTLFDRNLVVTAGAGTGKTAILVERALNLLGSGSTVLENLALITFTEKAAAELRLRLGRGLERLLGRGAGSIDAPPDPAQDGDRSWQWLTGRGVAAGQVRSSALAALHALDGAAIGTIHAFCSEILRRYPRQAGVDPLFAADDGAVFDRIFDETWAARLAADLGPAAPRAAAWKQALGAGDPPARVREVALALSAFSLPDEARLPAAAADPVVLLGEAAREALLRVRGIADRGSRFRPKFQDFLAAAIVYLEAFLAGGGRGLHAVDGPLSLEAAAEVDVGDPGKRAIGVSAAETGTECTPARELLRLLAGLDDQATAAIQAVAGPVAAAAGERLLSQGFVSFDAMLRRARDLLARDPAVRREVGERYRRLLVDEFQDTDPLQYEILFFLAGGETPPATDAYRTDLEPGRLFIVGDPKQSIYRFRGADISAYRRAVDHVTRCGGLELRLTASFRSPASLLAPVNRLFEGWLGPAGHWEGDYEPPYDRIESALPAGSEVGPRVLIASVEAGEGADAGERRAAEAGAIAAWISAHAAAVGPGAAYRYRDIAILFRAMTHSGLYARALRAVGIPFVIEGGRDFHQRPEVADLLMLLRAVASPNDAPALLAVLRSPMGAVPDDELARYARAGGRIAIPDALPTDPVAYPNLARTLAWLDRFRAATRRLPADSIVERALTSTPLAILHAATHDGPQRLQNLRKMAAIARERAARGLSLSETIALIEAAFEGHMPEGESPLADETHDAVRVLSIHKAKGLEYPVVFVPDLGREEGGGGHDGGAAAAWLRHGETGLLALRLEARRWNAAWALHALESERHAEAEERRVFYVACTRARERLILVNSHHERRAPWRDRLAVLGYRLGDDGAFPADGPLGVSGVEHRVLHPSPSAPLPSPTPDIDPIERAARVGGETAAALAAAAVPPLRSPSGTRPQDHARPEEATGAARPLALVRGRRPDSPEVRRYAGIAVHAALERWDYADGAALRERAAAEAFRAVDDAHPAGDRDRLGEAVKRETAVILDGFLASPLPARLAAVTLLGREVALLWRATDGLLWTGACDILFEEAGDLVVGDWKTDEVTGEPAGAAARYHDQMARYIEAVRAAFPGRAVRGEVLFVRHGLAVAMRD